MDIILSKKSTNIVFKKRIFSLMLILLLSFSVTYPVVLSENAVVNIGTSGGDSQLVADAGGPYSGYVDEIIYFDGSGSGFISGGSGVSSITLIQEEMYIYAQSSFTAVPTTSSVIQENEDKLPSSEIDDLNSKDGTLPDISGSSNDNSDAPDSNEGALDSNDEEPSGTDHETIIEDDDSTQESSDSSVEEPPSTDQETIAEGSIESSNSVVSDSSRIDGQSSGGSSHEAIEADPIEGFEEVQAPGYPGTGLEYRWDFDDDGNWDTNWMDSPYATYSYAEARVYEVTLEVRDGDKSATGETTVTIEQPGDAPEDDNIPPVADAGGPYFQWKEKIQFNGENSYDPDGEIIGYRWDVDGDGRWDTEWRNRPKYKYKYTEPGVYNVTLQVKDDNNSIDTDTTTATVVDSNTEPVADAGGPYFGIINETIYFNGSKSYDPDGEIVNYTWSFGDGQKGYGVAPEYKYVNNGTFTVTLTVTDDGEKTNKSSTFAFIALENMPPDRPEITITQSVENPNLVILTAVAHDPNNDNIKYFVSWDNGDNTTSPMFPSGTLLTTQYTYYFKGVYNVTVSAIDEHNASSEKANVTVVINESIGNQVVDQIGNVIGTIDDLETHYIMIVVIFVALAFLSMLVHFFRKRQVNF